MSVEIREARRTTRCRGCGHSIARGERMVDIGNYQSVAYLCFDCLKNLVYEYTELYGDNDEGSV